MHNNKALVSLVFGLGLILIGGLCLLVYGFIQKADDPNFKFFKNEPVQASVPASNSSVTQPQNVTIPLPSGSKIKEMAASGNKIILHITTKDEIDQILVYTT